jgi:hypothetical protein
MDDQDKILDLLRQQVQAEQEKAAEIRRQNDLAEQSLKNLQQARRAEAQRTRLWLEIAEQTAGLVQQLPEMALLVHGYDEKLTEFDEHLRELAARLDRIEYALMLLLSPRGEGIRAKALIEDIEKDRRERLIEEHKRHLYELEIKRAGYGRLDAPAHLLIQIEDLKKEIEQLEQG